MALKKPKKSKVSYDLSGKTMLLYGTNSTGKTFQAVHFPKPIVLAAEYGLNGLKDIDYFLISTWSNYTSTVKDFMKNLDELKENYETIVVDELSVLGGLCEQFICNRYGVNRINDANNGFGAWKEYENEFKRWMVSLNNLGLTVIYIAHEGTRDFTDENGQTYSKLYPKGDKRIVDPVADACDIIAYARVNNPDDNGNEVKSSLYLKGSRKFHARSRFPAMVPYLKEFTAENLQKAIHDAVASEDSVSYESQKESMKIERKSYDELFNQIRSIAIKMNEDGKGAQYKEVVKKYLGENRGVQDTTPEQTQVLEMILSDLEECA